MIIRTYVLEGKDVEIEITTTDREEFGVPAFDEHLKEAYLNNHPVFLLGKTLRVTNATAMTVLNPDNAYLVDVTEPEKQQETAPASPEPSTVTIPSPDPPNPCAEDHVGPWTTSTLSDSVEQCSGCGEFRGIS